MPAEELPLPDYDQIPLGSLRHRIRSLTEPQLRTVVEHECAHGNRVAVLEVLRARLAELEAGAQPAPGDPANAPGASHGSAASPAAEATKPENNTPLRHGMAEQTPKRGRP
ncbi:hypothetical protein FHX82_006075 [Amycolatopsis bartoniae]|uniref:DUF8129 domain-containing protein n=1 Tax=Amycolatopsis bartoniae TaxID=941986 RepID=A0A8H9MEW5_9PSEU|nr:hypothetical protein [Amycolatopsis bartoniae]MBB2938989.1 hypothetical protein [Amycolatopsis bartoniae]TVT04245.1 hypothetical protein FNH07_24190 [Amycolatopsis bartoniae]GHF65738.1 hypothetical protein GCM10017566_44180 [Amycolatopsis bartoniae]